ncbi:MAG TPA: YdcF family protein [Gaiellales bacterium]|nr:YdcF family protein [Gaiellales bacterium]
MAGVLEKPAPGALANRPDGVPDRVIVVLGYHEIGDDGSHGISSICRAAVRRAEQIAAELRPRAVIFTGWSSTGGPAEADLMAQEWRGPAGVPLIREPQAVNTAENAVRSLALVRSIEGASEVVLVCSIRHFPRARFLFDRLYRRHGYATRYRYVVRPLPSLPLVRHELRSIARMARDRRRAVRLLGEAERSRAKLSEAERG